MSISSEQYKTALFEQCRRAIRVPNENYRVAWYGVVYNVLEHEGVYVDEEGYEGFKQSLEGYLRYLSDNDILTGSDIHDDSNFVTSYETYWAPAFAGIGITTTTTDPANGSVTFSFTYPDGITEKYTLSDSDVSPVEVNSRFYSTLAYAEKIQDYWLIEPTEDTVPLNEIPGHRASFVTNWGEGGLYWRRSAEDEDIEIYGEGELKMVPARFTSNTNGLGLGNIKTAYYGAGVNALPLGAFDWCSGANKSVNIICYHGANDPVTLAGNVSTFTNANAPYTLHIYCDNLAIRNATFAAGANPQWYSLTEWPG